MKKRINIVFLYSVFWLSLQYLNPKSSGIEFMKDPKISFRLLKLLKLFPTHFMHFFIFILINQSSYFVGFLCLAFFSLFTLLNVASSIFCWSLATFLLSDFLFPSLKKCRLLMVITKKKRMITILITFFIVCFLA